MTRSNLEARIAALERDLEQTREELRQLDRAERAAALDEALAKLPEKTLEALRFDPPRHSDMRSLSARKLAYAERNWASVKHHWTRMGRDLRDRLIARES